MKYSLRTMRLFPSLALRYICNGVIISRFAVWELENRSNERLDTFLEQIR